MKWTKTLSEDCSLLFIFLHFLWHGKNPRILICNISNSIESKNELKTHKWFPMNFWTEVLDKFRFMKKKIDFKIFWPRFLEMDALSVSRKHWRKFYSSTFQKFCGSTYLQQINTRRCTSAPFQSDNPVTDLLLRLHTSFFSPLYDQIDMSCLWNW